MKIRVKPAAHLDRLEEVLVLQTRQELNLKKAAGCRHRAGRILQPHERRPWRPTLPAKKPTEAH